MFAAPTNADPRSPAVLCHLLGTVEFDACLALQHRLVYDAAGRSDGQITLLVCEHPATITVGRQGSRGDVHLDHAELHRRQLDVRWVNRGGGALLHAPGQLAVYPIVPLEFYRWTVGQYVERLQEALAGALVEDGFQVQPALGRCGVWGRSGQLAALGVAVRNWVTYFGAYINVAPAMQLVRRVDAVGDRHSPMSSLVAERRQPVKMTSVRERVARHVSAAFGCSRYHLFTGHPLLVPATRVPRETTARAG